MRYLGSFLLGLILFTSVALANGIERGDKHHLAPLPNFTPNAPLLLQQYLYAAIIRHCDLSTANGLPSIAAFREADITKADEDILFSTSIDLLDAAGNPVDSLKIDGTFGAAPTISAATGARCELSLPRK